MKLEGFIGPAYTLDSPNVDAQACVNLYLEGIESGRGKEAQQAYLRETPGLEQIAEVGTGPIRLIHTDSIGRLFVVSGSKIYSLGKKADWRFLFTPSTPAAITFPDSDVNSTDNDITEADHGFFTGLKVRATTTGTLPTPIVINTDYYVIRTSANKLKLATSFANALAGTAIDFSDNGGTGNNTLTPQAYSAINSKFSEIDFTANSFFYADHGLPDGMAVSFKATGQVPSAISEGTTYYVTNRTDDTFQLASSYSNALAGTSIDLSDVDDEWNVKQLGSLGEFGGSPVILASSSGPVKAASMSFGGDGTDSSTIFVDGENNYLLRDSNGSQSLGFLGETFVARAVVDIDQDITINVAENIDTFVSGGGITVSCVTNHTFFSLMLDPDSIYIFVYKDVLGSTGEISLKILVALDTGQSLTTAQLVSYLAAGNFGETGGAALGKTIRFGDVLQASALSGDPLSLTPPGGTTRYNFSPNGLSVSGGGSQTTTLAFGTPVTASFSKVTTSDEGYGSVPTATQIVWSDGFFILNKFGTNQFFVSDLQGFNVDALNFASSEGSPDILLALAILNRYLYAFNEKTLEVYANTGNADFPYERIQGGGFIEIGLAAEYSVARCGEEIAWLGRSADGEGVVYAISGMQPRRISTHAIEQAIRGYADTSSATAYSYSSGGHRFYVLSFDEATWAYDFATGAWHSRAYLNEGELERHRAEFYAYDMKRKKHLVSDYETNLVYELKEGVYTDNGDAIMRMRTSPHLSSDGKRIAFYKLQIDMETGVGLDGSVQGSNPTALLDWSDDGGHTWSSESEALLDAGAGQIGEYSKRVIWRRLGSSRDRIFRFKMTDPVKCKLINAIVEIEGRAS